MENNKSKARERLEEFVAFSKRYYNTKPIYEIVLFERAGDTYDKYGLPNHGIDDHPAFYYDLDTAIRAMNENWGDIQDCAFHAGFVYARFPGAYSYCGPESRMYFLWDEERKGFFEAEEPNTYEHISL